MAVRIGDTLKQMNDLDFPIAEAKDISLGDSNVQAKYEEVMNLLVELKEMIQNGDIEEANSVLGQFILGKGVIK